MALVHTRDAIGAVTQLLCDRLGPPGGALSVPIAVGRPESPAPSTGGGNERLNLFLFRLELDGHLRNVKLDSGQPTPLWLVLHYLLTAFDSNNDSDSVGAHHLLGAGLRALNDLNFRGLYADAVPALADNPDRLKISFDEADPDLLAKLMHDSEGQFRLSAAFQVRPVMIASARPSEASLLVGVDYSAGSGTIIGADGIRLPVLPSLGPRLSSLSPASVELGETLEVTGDGLDAAGLVVALGPVELPAIAQRSDWLQVQLPETLSEGERIRAGSHGVAVVQLRPGGRRRGSNLLVGAVRPSLADAQASGLAWSDPLDSASRVHGTVYLQGALMGGDADDIQVTLYRPAEAGIAEVVRGFDSFGTVPSPPAPTSPIPQTWMSLTIPSSDPLPQGQYRVILRVNGQQARHSPLLDLSLP